MVYADQKLVLDDTEIPAVFHEAKLYAVNGEYTKWNYAPHAVITTTKGSHTIKLQIKNFIENTALYAWHRRLSIIKGFYQGGTT